MTEIIMKKLTIIPEKIKI